MVYQLSSKNKKAWLTEDIEWFIQVLRRDKRGFTPEQRLELAAEFIDLAMELVRNNELQRIREKSHKNSGKKQH